MATRTEQTPRTYSGSSAILKGTMLTVAFYLVVPYVPGTTQFVQRYFCGHPIEYASSLMFFIGLSILWDKIRHLSRERAAVGSMMKLTSDVPVEAVRNAPQILQLLSGWESTQQQSNHATAIRRRVHEAMHYVRGRDEGSLEDHLRYLADLATDRLHQSYALMRTITWAIPILGFLGTVIGITVAIANVTPEQLDSSLPEVTAGLAIAFDTTAQALGMSIVLVFGAFLVERGEQSVLNDVEQFGIDHLQRWIGPDVTDTPKSRASTELSGISEWTETLLRQQTQSWNEHLYNLQSHWSKALTEQTDHLSTVLDAEVQTTLKVHRDSTADARDAYTEILHQTTQQFASQMQQTLMSFTDRVDAWQKAMLASSQASALQSEELHRLGRTLLQLTESEERLANLQHQLNENLQTLQVVATLEQTVSSLNAAVHVLTAKSQLRSAA